MREKIGMVSLGCAKNQVNAEQMLYLLQEAGFEISGDPAGCDLAIVNTCGFIESAKAEAIDHILALGQLKAQGQLGKILVTGCLSQRYPEEILQELPEVDGVMGTGSYSDIVSAVEQTLAGTTVMAFGDIDAPLDETPRVLTSPDYYATMEEDLTVEVERKTGALPKVHEVEVEKTRLLVEVADELYADQKLEGAVFVVTDDRSGRTRRLVTDAAGSAVLTDLQKNTTYHIQQTQTVGDYRMGEGGYDVVVSADGRIEGQSMGRLELTNRLLRVSIHALDMVLGSDTINEPLTLYNEQGQVILSWTTNGQGMLLTDLPEGNYTVIRGEEEEKPYHFAVTDTAEVQNWSISIFTFRSAVALAVAALFAVGGICLIVWLLRLAARRRKERRETASAGSNEQQ